jgi:hypothetical protein
MDDNLNTNHKNKSYRQIIELWVKELLPILEYRALNDFTPLCSKDPIDAITKSIIEDPQLEEKNVRDIFITNFQLFCESFEVTDHQKGMSDNYVDLANVSVMLDKGYGVVANIIRDRLDEDREHSRELKETLQPVNLACKKAREIVQRKREAVFAFTNPLEIAI